MNMGQLQRAAVLFALLCMASGSVGSGTNSTGSVYFIKSSCNATRYPALCVRSLSAYASAIEQSPMQLAQTALSLTLVRARSTLAYVAKLSGATGLAAMKDCKYNMKDSVDQLAQSVQELDQTVQAGSADFLWHMSNVQTWVSAALTDETTCLDGFDEVMLSPELKAAARRRIVKVAHVTSNALDLVNQYTQYTQRLRNITPNQS